MERTPVTGGKDAPVAERSQLLEGASTSDAVVNTVEKLDNISKQIDNVSQITTAGNIGQAEQAEVNERILGAILDIRQQTSRIERRQEEQLAAQRQPGIKGKLVTLLHDQKDKAIIGLAGVAIGRVIAYLPVPGAPITGAVIEQLGTSISPVATLASAATSSTSAATRIGLAVAGQAAGTIVSAITAPAQTPVETTSSVETTVPEITAPAQTPVETTSSVETTVPTPTTDVEATVSTSVPLIVTAAGVIAGIAGAISETASDVFRETSRHVISGPVLTNIAGITGIATRFVVRNRLALLARR